MLDPEQQYQNMKEKRRKNEKYLIRAESEKNEIILFYVIKVII